MSLSPQPDIRELLVHAPASFSTIDLECAVETRSDLFKRALQRAIPDFADRVAEGSITMLEAHHSQSSSGRENPQSGYEWRVWWRKPSCWRDDIIWETGATAVSIVCHALSSTYVSPLGSLYTNQQSTSPFARLSSLFGMRGDYTLPTVANRLEPIPLIDPSFFAQGWALTMLDQVSYADRTALRLTAARVDAIYPPCLWEGVDDYELLVDRERGILLRCAGMIDGEAANVFSVRSVRFDEPISDDIFSHQPPAGTKLIRQSAG